MNNLNQTDWKSVTNQVFEDQLIAKTFIALADTWSGSRDIKFQDFEKEKLAHIYSYLRRHKHGEYVTEMSKQPSKFPLIRRVCVGQACITVNAKGNDYLLIQAPSKANRYQWKLPGGKLHGSDRAKARSLSLNQTIENFLKKHSGRRLNYNLMEFFVATLRELNEELPFRSILRVVDDDSQVWISAKTNKDIAKTEFQIHDDLSFVDISKQYVELNAGDFFIYKNRRKEKSGREKYHGIRLESELMNVHGRLLSLSSPVDIQARVKGNANVGEFSWLLVTPSTIENLDGEPHCSVSKELILSSLNIKSESRVITPCLHENSLIESIISPVTSGSNIMTLSKKLYQLTDSFDSDTKKSICSDIDDRSFTNWLDDADSKTSNNPFPPLKIRDDPRNGYMFSEGMHSRNQQLAIARISGELWRRGKLPHGFRYRQIKRRDSANLFHLHNISAEIMHARIATQKLNTTTDSGENKPLTNSNGGISFNFSSRIIYPKSEVTKSNKILEMSLDDLIISYPELFKYKEYFENVTNLNWKPINRRMKAAYSMMNRVGCDVCSVGPGEPCKNEMLSHFRKEEFSIFGQQKVTRMTIPNDYLSNALTVDLVNKIAQLVYHSEGFENEFSPTNSQILKDDDLPISSNNITEHWKALKPGKRVPTRPFICQSRWEKCCTKLDVEGIIETHLLPAGLRNKSGNKTSKGRTSSYLSTTSTEPPLILQNQFYTILKRDLELTKNIRIKGGNLYYDIAKTRQTSNSSENELLIWECITNNPKRSITTIAIDEPRDCEQIKVPILRVAKNGKIPTNRFNFDSEVIKQTTDNCIGTIFNQPLKTNLVLEQSENRWEWNRMNIKDDNFSGVLPIITPDFSIREAMEIANLNGVGVAISIDSWEDINNLEYEVSYGSVDQSWYIDGDLFDDSEPNLHRTFSSFIRYLSETYQLNIKEGSVRHSRRLYGILLLEDLINFFI